MKPSVPPLLLAKYDRPVPRYTSYPTVPAWTGLTKDAWYRSLESASAGRSEAELALSLYVHIPYCHSLCAFCACTRDIRRDRSLAPRFVDSLLRELELKSRTWPAAWSRARLRELHLGGGTPTWLPPAELSRLIGGIRERLPNADQVDISIEIDPRSFRLEHADALQSVGVHRASLGVQDFHVPTLRAIKRYQSRDQVELVVDALRARGIDRINFDFVFGLPLQTESTMAETGRHLAQLRPSRVAVYSYAHLPSLKPAQRDLERHGLPEAAKKRALYESLRESVETQGYVEIGMDHFALPEDELVAALTTGTLHRNFMGYTPRRTDLLVGLGPSSLSDSGFAFAQNEKDVERWHDRIERGDVDPIGGHALSREDRRRRQIILDLMCRFSTRLSDDEWTQIALSEITTVKSSA